MLTHPSSGACDLFDELMHGLYGPSSMYVPEQNPGEINPLFQTVTNPHLNRPVMLQHAYRYHTTTNATPTYIEPEPYNPYNNS